MKGEHRAPTRWAPAGVAGTLGFFLLSQAVMCALSGWLGWWRHGDLAGLVLFVGAAVLIAWALGYATAVEEGPP